MKIEEYSFLGELKHEINRLAVYKKYAVSKKDISILTAESIVGELVALANGRMSLPEDPLTRGHYKCSNIAASIVIALDEYREASVLDQLATLSDVRTNQGDLEALVDLKRPLSGGACASMLASMYNAEFGTSLVNNSSNRLYADIMKEVNWRAKNGHFDGVYEWKIPRELAVEYGSDTVSSVRASAIARLHRAGFYADWNHNFRNITVAW